MKPPFEFEPRSFTDVFDPDGGNGPALWEWLWRDDNLTRMETASDLWKVAVEPLQRGLLSDFGPKVVRKHRIKQMLGRMARQILESRGYVWAGKDYKVPTGDLFTTGSKYRREDEDEDEDEDE